MEKNILFYRAVVLGRFKREGKGLSWREKPQNTLNSTKNP